MSWESGALLFQSSKEKGFLFSVQGKDLQKKPKAEKVLEFQEAYEFSKRASSSSLSLQKLLHALEGTAAGLLSMLCRFDKWHYHTTGFRNPLISICSKHHMTTLPVTITSMSVWPQGQDGRNAASSHGSAFSSRFQSYCGMYFLWHIRTNFNENIETFFPHKKV